MSQRIKKPNSVVAILQALAVWREQDEILDNMHGPRSESDWNRRNTLEQLVLDLRAPLEMLTPEDYRQYAADVAAAFDKAEEAQAVVDEMAVQESFARQGWTQAKAKLERLDIWLKRMDVPSHIHMPAHVLVAQIRSVLNDEAQP